MSNNHQDIDDEFKALCQMYGESLPKKIQQIQVAFADLSYLWDMKNFIELSSLIHKLNGSAGIYGYKQISEKSGKIEQTLSRYDYDIPADRKIMAEIEKLILEIQSIVDSQTLEIPSIILQTIQMNLVYLLHNTNSNAFEKSWSTKLAEQAAIYGYEIVTFDDIESLFDALKNKTPLALLINFDLLSNPFVVNLKDINLHDIINLYFKKIHTIFIANSGEFEKRLHAVRMGCKSYLLIPFNTDELIAELDNLKFMWNGNFRAIIIDDDPEILKYHSNLLANANIENKTLTSYINLEHEMHNFQPDIILLDLNMPNCSGIEIAAIIRQQKSYEDIPIVFLSTEENRNIQLSAMSVGADDFITKASDPNYLIQTIRNKASRYKKLKYILTKDNLTGAFNFRYISREIEKYIEGYKNKGKNFLICVTKIDNIDSIISSYGYPASDQLLKSLSVLLSNQLDSSRIIGHRSSDKFLIIFPNVSIDEVRIEMQKIQEKFFSTLQYADGNAYASTFSIGMALYQNGYSIEKLIEKADSDLAVVSSKKAKY